MDLRFLFDWNEAARRPIPTALAIFALSGPAFGVLAFGFVTHRHLLASAIIGVLGGLGLALGIYAQGRGLAVGDEVRRSRRRRRIVSGMFRLVLVLGGAAAVVGGSVEGDARLAISGALLLMLGVVLAVVPRRGR